MVYRISIEESSFTMFKLSVECVVQLNVKYVFENDVEELLQD